MKHPKKTQKNPKIAFLALQNAIFAEIRAFFAENGFIEVSTPVRIPAPALEDFIDAEPSGTHFLRTSPELHMKRLLAAGCERIFQIGPCFRQGEYGLLHRPEFTMLEWYQTDADYMKILDDTQNLLRFVQKNVKNTEKMAFQGRKIDIFGPWHKISVQNAYLQFAGWDPLKNFDPDRFDLDMAEKIEPNLEKFDQPVILYDYPAQTAALSRKKPENPSISERFELYIAGIELANAFSELTDPAEQRKRFEKCAENRKMRQKPVYPLDEPFLQALEAGLPPSGGIALGLDRLLMLFADQPSLDFLFFN
ncbi:MAG: EF-P lysine aminoacylase GenX [Spartobacteria bacterium]|nr:EF-P lysine aminoacylase GenX [Spartobacteria bacterium]